MTHPIPPPYKCGSCGTDHDLHGMFTKRPGLNYLCKPCVKEQLGISGVFKDYEAEIGRLHWAMGLDGTTADERRESFKSGMARDHQVICADTDDAMPAVLCPPTICGDCRLCRDCPHFERNAKEVTPSGPIPTTDLSEEGAGFHDDGQPCVSPCKAYKRLKARVGELAGEAAAGRLKAGADDVIERLSRGCALDGPTICAECVFELHSMEDRQPVNYRCQHKDTQCDQNLMTGERVARYCRDINDGKCEYFQRKEASQ